MKHNRLLLIPALVCLLLTKHGDHQAQADTISTKQAGPLTAHVSLVSSPTVSLGEPVVLHYTVDNTSPTQQISFDGGAYHTGWYSLNLSDTKGRNVMFVPTSPTVGPDRMTGLHQAPDISIRPNEQLEGDIVATQVLVIPRPGNYKLTIHIPITYFVEPVGAWYPEGRPANQKPLIFDHEYSFPLVVTAADPAEQQATAEMVRRELQDVKFAGQSKALLTTLATLPEAVALPNWEALILDPATTPNVLSEAATLLGGLHSPAAADLLGQILFDRLPSDEASKEMVKYNARKAVAEMYNAGDEQIRQRLEQVYAQHGASVNDLRATVAVSDPN